MAHIIFFYIVQFTRLFLKVWVLKDSINYGIHVFGGMIHMKVTIALHEKDREPLPEVFWDLLLILPIGPS